MLQSIKSVLASVGNALPPEYDSRYHAISKLGKKALEQLPWALGAAAGFYLQYRQYGFLTHAKILVGISTGCAVILGTPVDHHLHAHQIVTLIKVVVVTAGSLYLGYNLFSIYHTVMELKLLCGAALTYSSATQIGLLLFKLFNAQTYCRAAFSLQHASRSLEAKWKPILSEFLKGYDEGDLCEVVKLMHQHEINQSFVLQFQFHLPPRGLIECLLDRIKNNPHHTQKIKHQFPQLFETSETVMEGLEDLPLIIQYIAQEENRVQRNQMAHLPLIQEFLLKIYKYPLSVVDIQAIEKKVAELNIEQASIEEVQNHLAFTQETLAKIEQFKTLYDEEPTIPDGFSTPILEKLAEQFKDSDQIYEKLPSIQCQLEALRKNLISRYLRSLDKPLSFPMDETLDMLGLTVGDYALLAEELGTSHFPLKKHVVEELNKRGLYCLNDLRQQQIIGDGLQDRRTTTQRLLAYLKGKPMQALAAQDPVLRRYTSLSLLKRVQRIGQACFNIGMTAVELGIQLKASPFLTSLSTGIGIFYPQVQQHFYWNNLRHSQASLFYTPSFLDQCNGIKNRVLNVTSSFNTTDWTGRLWAFSAGVNQGQTLRDYFFEVTGV